MLTCLTKSFITFSSNCVSKLWTPVISTYFLYTSNGKHIFFSIILGKSHGFLHFWQKHHSNAIIINGNALRHRSKSVKLVKFGICAPGPQSAPRGTETATFAKGFFQSSNLRKMLTCFTKFLITFSSNCVSLSKTLECPQTLKRGSLWPLFAYVYWKTQLFQIILGKSNGF